MTDADYVRYIYEIRAEIDAFDEAFWSQENCDPEAFTEYNRQRKILCDKLEVAFAANTE